MPPVCLFESRIPDERHLADQINDPAIVVFFRRELLGPDLPITIAIAVR